MSKTQIETKEPQMSVLTPLEQDCLKEVVSGERYTGSSYKITKTYNEKVAILLKLRHSFLHSYWNTKNRAYMLTDLLDSDLLSLIGNIRD